MNSQPCGNPAEQRLAKIRNKTALRLPVNECSDRRAQDVTRREEFPIAFKQQILQLPRGEVRVPPCRGRSIEAIEIPLRDPARVQERVVLFGSRDWSEDVERRHVGAHAAEDFEIFTDRRGCVFWKSDDVRKMADNAMPGTKFDNPVVTSRMILCLVGAK